MCCAALTALRVPSSLCGGTFDLPHVDGTGRMQFR
jgi:hypothetical protein